MLEFQKLLHTPILVLAGQLLNIHVIDSHGFGLYGKLCTDGHFLLNLKFIKINKHKEKLAEQQLKNSAIRYIFFRWKHRG